MPIDEERNRLVYERFIAGDRLSAIGRDYGKTKQWASQTVKGYARRHGLPWVPRRPEKWPTCPRCGGNYDGRSPTCAKCRAELTRNRRQSELAAFEARGLIAGAARAAAYLDMTTEAFYSLMQDRIIMPVSRLRLHQGQPQLFRCGDLDLLRAAGYGRPGIANQQKNINLDAPACPICGLHFVGGKPNRTYCSRKCKQTATNRRHYEQHKEQVIAKVIARRRRLAE